MSATPLRAGVPQAPTTGQLSRAVRPRPHCDVAWTLAYCATVAVAGYAPATPLRRLLQLLPHGRQDLSRATCLRPHCDRETCSQPRPMASVAGYLPTTPLRRGLGDGRTAGEDCRGMRARDPIATRYSRLIPPGFAVAGCPPATPLRRACWDERAGERILSRDACLRPHCDG
jgi:hypothetical protein